MKRSKFYFAVAALCIAPVLAYVVACSSSSDTLPSYSYNGPGSKWSVTLNTDGSFVITYAPTVEAAVEMTVNGTYTRLSTGFVKLVVTSSTGTGGPSAGETAYALEVPGFAFLLKPVGGESNLIPMVKAGSCPTTNLNANWIIMESRDTADATSDSQDWYGTFTHDPNTNNSSVATRYALTDMDDLGVGPLTGTTCNAGIMHIDSDNVDMFLTSGNGAIVHTNIGDPTDDSFIVAIPSETISSAADLNGEYGGLVFNKDAGAGSGDRIFPMQVTFTASSATAATVVGGKITDVESGTLGAGEASISLTAFNTPSAGFAQGTITIGASSGNVVCSANTNVEGSGKKLLFCIGQSPEDNTKHFNFLAVSK